MNLLEKHALMLGCGIIKQLYGESKMKAGDKVKANYPEYARGKGYPEGEVTIEKVTDMGHIVLVGYDPYKTVNFTFPADWFSPIETKETPKLSKFKVGDKVRLLKNSSYLYKNEVGHIKEVLSDGYLLKEGSSKMKESELQSVDVAFVVRLGSSVTNFYTEEEALTHAKNQSAISPNKEFEVLRKIASVKTPLAPTEVKSI
jgi:hypothetical protein